MLQNLGSLSADFDGDALRLLAPAPATPPDDGTAFSSPPSPVDFSAEVAASVRR